MKFPFSDENQVAKQNYRGVQLNEAEDFEGAVACFQEALRHSPDDPVILCNLGLALSNHQQFDAAENAYRMAFTSDPTRVEAACACAFEMQKQDKQAECIRYCLELLEAFPGNTELNSHLLNPLFLTGNFEEAKDRFEAMAGNESAMEITVGLVYGALGNHRQALEVFRSLVKGNLEEVLRSIVEGNPEGMAKVLSFIRSISKCGKAGDIDAAYRDFERTAGSNYKTWAHYQFARFYTCRKTMDLFEGEPEISLSPPPRTYCPATAGMSRQVYHREEMEALKESLAVPHPSRESLARNIAEFMELSGEIIAEGHFDRHMENLKACRRHFNVEAHDPVFVMSTGRCGTLGLHEFLKKSMHVIPYHTLDCQLLPMDRNHVLYRIIEGNLDKEVLTRILSAYLETRSAEILFACRNGKTPVIVNHWDTVFAPFNAVLYTGSKFIHLHRDETKVFRSFYGKNQLQNQQLQHFRYDPEFPDGRFVFFPDDGPELNQMIAWYLFITSEFSRAFAETVADGRVVSIRSEDLFARSREHFDILRQTIPIDDLDYEDFCESYEAPVNPKNEKLQVNEDDVGPKAARVPELLKYLESHGGF